MLTFIVYLHTYRFCRLWSVYSLWSVFVCSLFLSVDAVAQRAPQVDLSVPVFTGSNELSSDSGYAQIRWSHPDYEPQELPEGIGFEIQFSESEDFASPTTKYRGPDTATYISGLPNGTYYLRVRTIETDGEQASGWSEPLTLTVRHHSLQLAAVLMALGCIVFVSTVIVILYGNRKMEAESASSR